MITDGLPEEQATLYELVLTIAALLPPLPVSSSSMDTSSPSFVQLINSASTVHAQPKTINTMANLSLEMEFNENTLTKNLRKTAVSAYDATLNLTRTDEDDEHSAEEKPNEEEEPKSKRQRTP